MLSDMLSTISPNMKPLATAQDARLDPVSVELFLDDPQKRVLLGVPEGLPADDPKNENAFWHATELDRAGKHKEAERIYLELLNMDFKNTVVHAALGMNYAINGKSGLAHRLLKYAYEHREQIYDDFIKLGITPSFQGDAKECRKGFDTVKTSEILNAMGTCYKNENITDMARDLFERAQRNVPPNADIQNNIGTLWINEGDPIKALEILNGAISLNPDHPQAHWNKSLALLELGQFGEGWDEYDYGFPAKVRVDRNYAREMLPQWDGSKGKRLALFGEQGIGDEILFMSMLPEIARDSELVVVDCHKKLHRLFCESFPTIDFYPTREDQQITWPFSPDGKPRYDFNCKLSVGSAGRWYRRNVEDFPGTPFLKAPADSFEKFKERLATLPRKPNIGISWEGGHKRTRKEVRSIPLADLEPILRQDANWISLQYTPCEKEIHEFTKRTGITIHHWPDACYSPDYAETAGLVANLDLVISVATSVIHLAGGLGIPCWVLTASRAAWREHFGGDGNVWYKSLTMFRQDKGSTEWKPVIDEVSAALASLLESVK